LTTASGVSRAERKRRSRYEAIAEALASPQLLDRPGHPIQSGLGAGPDGLPDFEVVRGADIDDAATMSIFGERQRSPSRMRSSECRKVLRVQVTDIIIKAHARTNAAAFGFLPLGASSVRRDPKGLSRGGRDAHRGPALRRANCRRPSNAFYADCLGLEFSMAGTGFRSFLTKDGRST